MQFTAKTPQDMIPAATSLAAMLRSTPIAAFYGNMGVGKTTFIKILCKQLGVTDTVSSPSFAIINEYRLGNGSPVFHFDFYRMKEPEELYGIGADEYFYSGEICLIEWPEKVAGFIPENRLNVHIEEMAEGSRSISVSSNLP